MCQDKMCYIPRPHYTRTSFDIVSFLSFVVGEAEQQDISTTKSTTSPTVCNNTVFTTKSSTFPARRTNYISDFLRCGRNIVTTSQPKCFLPIHPRRHTNVSIGFNVNVNETTFLSDNAMCCLSENPSQVLLYTENIWEVM